MVCGCRLTPPGTAPCFFVRLTFDVLRPRHLPGGASKSGSPRSPTKPAISAFKSSISSLKTSFLRNPLPIKSPAPVVLPDSHRALHKLSGPSGVAMRPVSCTRRAGGFESPNLTGHCDRTKEARSDAIAFNNDTLMMNAVLQVLICDLSRLLVLPAKLCSVVSSRLLGTTGSSGPSSIWPRG